MLGEPDVIQAFATIIPSRAGVYVALPNAHLRRPLKPSQMFGNKTVLSATRGIGNHNISKAHLVTLNLSSQYADERDAVT